jgi:hypothetical protein
LPLNAIDTIAPCPFPHLITKLKKRVPDMPALAGNNVASALGGKLKKAVPDVIGRK